MITYMDSLKLKGFSQSQTVHGFNTANTVNRAKILNSCVGSRILLEIFILNVLSSSGPGHNGTKMRATLHTNYHTVSDFGTFLRWGGVVLDGRGGPKEQLKLKLKLKTIEMAGAIEHSSSSLSVVSSECPHSR